MDPQDKSAGNLFWAHWLVLTSGGLAGLAAAVLVSGIPIDFSAQLAEAKRLGIVSKTILAGYPKSRDVLTYAVFLLLPVICSVGAWLLWSRGRRPALAGLLQREPVVGATSSGKRRILAVAIFLTFVFLTFNVNDFYEPVGGWAFLGEEGQFLAWAQVLLSGGEYARDFFCLYGPLAVYPLTWAMELFGVSVLVGRIYTYGLVLISAAILIVFLYRTIRSHGIFILGSILAFMAFPPFAMRTSATMLRIFLGFVPLLILFRHAGSDRKLPATAAGGVLGITLLFSQEVGLCALVATGVFLCLEARAGDDYRRLLRQGGLVAAGCLMVVGTMLGYLYSRNALGEFFDSLYGYPKLVTLGYGSVPFPSFADFLAAPLSGAYFPYWIIGMYVFAAISLIVRLFLGRGNRNIHLRGALLVFGLLLFRAALGRSDDSHFYFALPPALLLAFLMLDDAASGPATRPNVAKIGGRGLIAALLLSMALLFGTSRVLHENTFAVLSGLPRLPSKFTVRERGVALPQLSRGGTFYHPKTAEDLEIIGNALDRHTKRGDPVLFFPNEAAYYFLFDRKVPTRFVHAYFAATAAHRREMVAELEQRQPAFVVYSLDTWRIDDISENIQVPEVVDYLNEKYHLAEDLGGILILRRKGL